MHRPQAAGNGTLYQRPRAVRATFAHMLDVVLICFAGLLAGAVNSLAGGGTLLSFPMLVWLGRDPVVANATNALALWPASLASVLALRKEAWAERRMLGLLAPASMIGGLLGSYTLLVTPERLFDFLVPVLVLGATIVLALRRQLAARLPLLAAGAGGGEGARIAGSRATALWGVQLLVATYGGYFGAAMGILMLASLGLFGIADIHARNAIKNALAALINATAAIYFINAGAIVWLDAALLGGSAAVGGYVGARLARRFDPKRVERAVISFGVAASLILAYRVFAR